MICLMSPQCKYGYRFLVAGITLALFLLAAALYWPVRGNGFFVIDDGLHVLANDRVKEGLSWPGVRWAFSSVGYAHNWHPIAWLSHMADVQLFGLDASGHHLTSLLSHAVVTGLLFLSLWVMTGALWRSAAVAVLHAVHPLRVESVAWVAERKDLLVAMFWVLGLVAWTRYARQPNPGRYSLVVLCHALGLMTKPMMVTFPLVLLLIDAWPLGRFSLRAGGSWKRLLLSAVMEKAPLLLMSLAVGLITVWAQGTAVVPLASISATDRALISVRALLRYLRTALWPSDLAPYYPLEAAPGVVVSLVGVILVVGISLLVWRLRRRAAWLATGWAWFIVTLLPVLGLVKAGWQEAADRFTYIPLTGLLIAVVWSIPRSSRRGLSGFAAWLLLPAVIGLALATRAQIGWWKDSETLLRRTLAVTEVNWFAHLELGKLLTGKGRLTEGEEQLRQALAVFPDLPEAHRGIAAIRLREGKALEAAEGFQRAAAARPGEPGIWYDLGTALAAAGRHDEAAASFQRALELEPGTSAFWWGLQGELALAGREGEARRVLGNALQRFPDSAEFHADAGVLAARAGDLSEAEGHFTRALELNPGDENARRNLVRLRTDLRWRRADVRPGGAAGAR
ncbi:MAG TPA: tetratricopeptide repeat protein [Candidatus Methanoperedens sp.]|nr:tetratricopeptide repeat protein [Candidatus Methanoperedens sp.]